MGRHCAVAIIGLILSGLARADSIDDGLVAFWNFDGADVVDATGHGYDGTIHGNPTYSSGILGTAIELDGSGDYVNFGTSLNFPAWSNYTVSLWFLADSRGDYSDTGAKILDKTILFHDWYLTVLADTYAYGFRWHTYQGGTSLLRTDPADPRYTDARWHHVVAVKSGSAGALYLDNTLVDSGVVKTVYSSGDLLLGYSGSPDATQRQYFGGLIDEVRIYDRALGDDEIATLNLQAVPEPAALALLVVGALGLLARRRMR